MRVNGLITLLHLSDPTLPIGGYTHSYGLETYVQSGVVCDVDSAREFVENSLMHNAKYNDGMYVRLAWCAARDMDCERIMQLNDECTALKSPQEIRQASLKLGVRLLKIFNRRYNTPMMEALEAIVKQSEAKVVHYPIVYGVLAHLLGINLSDTLLSFYYNTMVCMVTNAVKLIPLGQLSGQDMIFDLQGTIEKLTQETIALDHQMRGVCAVGFDIAAMQHERLYSRLYMS